MTAKLPIYNISAISAPKIASHTLIEAVAPGSGGAPAAFLSWQNVGLGRVVYFSAPVTYQLRYAAGDTYHHRFWGQLLRWAIARDIGVGSKTVHLNTDKSAYETGEQAQITVRLFGADGNIVAGAQCSVEARQDGRVLKTIDLKEAPDSPGAYRATYENLPLGPLTLRATGVTVRTLLEQERHNGPVEQTIPVDPKQSTELSNPLCNLALLNQISSAAGTGAVVSPLSVQPALSLLNTTPEVKESVQSRRPVWDNWLLLWIFIGCLTFEWIVRKVWRMI
jgi:hypothetical protein